MKKYDHPILIVSDNETELEEIKLHLSSSFSRLYDLLDEELAIQLFETKRAAVLLLAFKSLHRAESFYLKLFHRCENIYEIPHQVVVFVTRSELARAYELCRRDIFHSFVIIRPLLSEHFLRLAVFQALEKRAAHLTIHRGRGLLKRLAGHFEQIRKEFDKLMSDTQLLQQNQRTAQRDLASSINYRLSVFRDSLTGGGMKNVVTVHDKAALHKEFDHLREEEITSQLEHYHGKMNDALGGWTQNLENKLTMLEQVSTDVVRAEKVEAPRILIIDDDDIQRHMLTSVLEERGYAVHQAANGNEGMSMLLARTPDLVLLDYEMPELDGVELLRKARLSPELRELPVIMLTGHNEKEVVKLCVQNGANDYLVKPVSIKTLDERLSHYFPRFHQAAQQPV